jgi:hypothetical protein
MTTIDVVGEHMARPDAITEMCFENVSLSEYGRICTGLRTDSQNRVFGKYGESALAKARATKNWNEGEFTVEARKA